MTDIPTFDDKLQKTPTQDPLLPNSVEARAAAWARDNADFIAEYNAEVEREGMSFSQWRTV